MYTSLEAPKNIMASAIKTAMRANWPKRMDLTKVPRGPRALVVIDIRNTIPNTKRKRAIIFCWTKSSFAVFFLFAGACFLAVTLDGSFDLALGFAGDDFFCLVFCFV